MQTWAEREVPGGLNAEELHVWLTKLSTEIGQSLDKIDVVADTTQLWDDGSVIWAVWNV